MHYKIIMKLIILQGSGCSYKYKIVPFFKNVLWNSIDILLFNKLISKRNIS